MYCDIVVLIFLINVIGRSFSHISADSNSLSELYDIEGKIYPPEAQVLSNWQVVTKVLVNGAAENFSGLYGRGPWKSPPEVLLVVPSLAELTRQPGAPLKISNVALDEMSGIEEFHGPRPYDPEDGTFTIHNVPSGSYVLEVVNPDYAYEPVRVEINSKGKYRARKVNYIQTSQVIPVTYPLKLKALSRLRYFQAREQWRITDFLFSPMVLMMVLPLLLIMVLPKMMNDPETRKEMEQINNLTKYDMPEMSEVLTSFFAGGEKQKSRAVKPSKKRQ